MEMERHPSLGRGNAHPQDMQKSAKNMGAVAKYAFCTEAVIASQWPRPASLALRAIHLLSQHWRGNPFPFKIVENSTIFKDTDPIAHTSDIGQWFAMTGSCMIAIMLQPPSIRKGQRLPEVHFHSETSGRSTPYFAIYCLCSTSLSFIC